ncbi:MAG: hypothetical protein E7291_08385 [Lachnospiraceae bacterium]|nr:hypothetical protein [Lachnospiraceae bacterium]
MKSLGRNLKYWVWNMEKQGLYMLLWIFIMVGLMTFIEGEYTTGVFVKTLPQYIFMIMFIFNFTNSFSGVITYLPLTVSLGSDRKSSYIAMQIALHLVMLEFMLIGLIPAMQIWFKESSGEKTLLLIAVLALSFLLMGIGSVISAVSLRFGKGVGVALYLVSIFAVIAAIAVVVILIGNGIISRDLSWIRSVIKPWLIVVCVVFDVCMMLLLYRCVSKRDLQFA